MSRGSGLACFWVLWGEQSIYQFNPWYKHARRVIVASDKRKDAAKGQLGNLVPSHLLNMNEAVTKAAFTPG